jgi:hypothetical protein
MGFKTKGAYIIAGVLAATAATAAALVGERHWL